MNIRRAEGSDAEAIARLHVASWQATYRNELPEEFLASQDLGARAAHWQGEIAGGATVLVAEEGEELLGFVSCGVTRDDIRNAEAVFEIYNLHVAPSRHGQGIGTALFGAALARARAAGALQLSLWVVETNADARSFYERRGMRADGAEQAHPVGPGAELREVRYRLDVPMRARQRLEGAVVMLVLLVIGVWSCPVVRERLFAVSSQRQFETADVTQARRAAQIEVQTLLRPVEERSIGGDQGARRWRLGLAYGRLALIEERAGDQAKRDRYFDLARRALREAGAKDPTDEFIRGCVQAGQCR